MKKPNESNYARDVYAGVLGKVIGVYMGRPIEGWSREAIKSRFGRELSGYVHEQCNVPLVVSDDDITGTLTFVRALEDSGLYEKTPADFFGKSWLDYIIENESILWWGGMGVSTEHTAYLRLKSGYESPRSGSTELNGKIVSEQIGAQIFIDAFGMVAPGRPDLAAKLAEKTASVSHDGEAVIAAKLVAAMISAAFVEKNMEKLLDLGLESIPADSTIAMLHRDVRKWARIDRDWEKTLDRIQKKYSYSKFGGFCHVVPNHALMVMAWSYAPDDFYKSQMIVNSAGWDTDCNAANVGALMGVKLGLSEICRRYDFISPFADRLILPTADGTRSVSDCLNEAMAIERIGRRIMGWAERPAPKKGAIHHFSMPGALHGYMAEEFSTESRSNAFVSNAQDEDSGEYSMRIEYRCAPGRMARISTPIYSAETKTGGASYKNSLLPRLYSGMSVLALGTSGRLNCAGTVRIRLFARLVSLGKNAVPALIYSQAQNLDQDNKIKLSWKIPDSKGIPIQDLGFEISSDSGADGAIRIDSVHFSGAPKIEFPFPMPEMELQENSQLARIPGWLIDADKSCGKFDGNIPAKFYVKNKGIGFLVTGTTDWRDYDFSAKVRVQLADRAGIIARYKGQLRNIALLKSPGKLSLVMRHYTETILGELKCDWAPDEFHTLRISLRGNDISAYCDGRKIFQAEDSILLCGGAGFLFENGMIGFRDILVRGA